MGVITWINMQHPWVKVINVCFHSLSGGALWSVEKLKLNPQRLIANEEKHLNVFPKINPSQLSLSQKETHKLNQSPKKSQGKLFPPKEFLRTSTLWGCLSGCSSSSPLFYKNAQTAEKDQRKSNWKSPPKKHPGSQKGESYIPLPR